VVIYPSSGTGAWEAALSNVLSPGDRVLMVETGHFATLWKNMAEKLGFVPELIPTDWRAGAKPDAIAARLADDKAHAIKAVCVVHSETSTGTISHIDEVRRAIDSVNHPALLLVDTVSSLGSVDFRHDEWGVDVAVSGSQKGLMMPPGLSFNAVSEKALAASKKARQPRSYWSWDEMIASNKSGYFPYTPATNMLYALGEAIDMLHEEGLENVFARHRRHGEAVRRAVTAWKLDIVCREPRDYSPVLTAVMMPEGYDADAFRKTALAHYDISLGTGLSKMAGKIFRIGHLGDTNDLTIVGALAGVEMALALAGVPHSAGGTQVAMEYLTSVARGDSRAAAE
jgi:alanine-glyoxylate transaminase/serine-glyoxylate transaminase/serine-pyruvate transaminase